MKNIRVITYLDKIDKKIDILQSTCKKYNINLEICGLVYGRCRQRRKPTSSGCVECEWLLCPPAEVSNNRIIIFAFEHFNRLF